MAFQKKIFLSILTISVVLFLFSGYVGLFEFIPLLREKIQSNDGDFLQLAGNAGVFYSFLIGVPISVIVALAASIIGGEITERQGDIDTLRFIEEKVSGALNVFIRILTALRTTLRTGNGLRDLVKSIVLTEIENAEQEDGKFSSDRLISATEEQFDGWKEALCEELDELHSAVEQSKSDLYAPLILRKSLERSNKDETALSYIQKHLPKNHGIDDSLLDPDPYQIGYLLHFWATRLTAHDAVMAYVLMPKSFRTSDYIGLMLKRSHFQPASGAPKKLGDLDVNDVYYNLGAAWIMQAYRVLPKKDDVSTIFREILKGRSPIALRLLDVVGPDVERLETRSWLAGMEQSLSARSNSIILRLADGSPRSYDPRTHGPLDSLNLAPVSANRR